MKERPLLEWPAVADFEYVSALSADKSLDQDTSSRFHIAGPWSPHDTCTCLYGRWWGWWFWFWVANIASLRLSPTLRVSITSSTTNTYTGVTAVSMIWGLEWGNHHVHCSTLLQSNPLHPIQRSKCIGLVGINKDIEVCMEMEVTQTSKNWVTSCRSIIQWRDSFAFPFL